MSVHMVGIDYHLADVDIRAVFSFTKKNAGEAMELLRKKPGIRGSVILSTCNRMELWVSVDDAYEGSLPDELCELKGVSRSEYSPYFVERSGRDAVMHLFRLTCGLESMILAEDQIITQVKDALSLARENYSTDNVLEVLFRKAVTAAKKVKTEVVFTHASATAVDRAIEMLRAERFDLMGKVCMVIGNGEMGKLAALALAGCGADVTVTVRQYRSGVVNIPVGCKRINYGERMKLLPSCDLVISATSSPNYTIRRELFTKDVVIDHPVYLIDLAVPRDIDPWVGGLEHITLYDIDTFKMNAQEANAGALIQAEKILDSEIEDFYSWYDCRDLIPRIQEVQTETVTDLNLRLQRIIRKLPLAEEEQRLLIENIDAAAGKVVGKMMYGLRDYLDGSKFRECLDGLEKLYDE
ncbi:glutamyl-tRNA reductase [Novisyntrophococcus fermenticellae]|uniref:glutamyl-tRNA reductase n=1 Tax=Novisyntrophococcus fermenticellae TaxID=2068655 RepID=UPI001E42FE08|nr:glutamyl-tRNA reductase [Novisyntrophococcus fermenticellae]